MSTLAEEILACARSWVGVPYVHRGTTRQGCDCTGLVIGCLQELGYLRGYRLRKYPPDWNLHAMADDHLQEEIIRVADRVGPPPEPGDLILFSFGKCIAHCGVMGKRPIFLHSHASAGCVQTASLACLKWSSRLASVWRLNSRKLEVTR